MNWDQVIGAGGMLGSVMSIITGLAIAIYQFAKLVGRVGGLEVRVGRLEERFDRLEGRIDRLEGRIDRLEERFKEIEKKVDQILFYLAPKFKRKKTKLHRKHK